MLADGRAKWSQFGFIATEKKRLEIKLIGLKYN